jgi:hypothetical protein
MTEPVMYFGIGFFVATLLGSLVVVRVHHRALHFGSVDQFHADVRQLEQQLAVALAERSRLQREFAAIKRDAETIWAAERVESALFRERINDVAYEVVRIIRSLETPGSSIGPISANAALVIEHGSRTQTLNINGASGEASATTMHMGALADRIHALRTTASRVAAN